MELLFKKKLFLFLALGSLILVSDQLFKTLIRLNDGFYICNPNIAFGIKIPDILFWIFWCGIILLLFYFLIKNFLSSNALYIIFILSGAISNLIDRIWQGCVIDFINLAFWPIFNLADFFITLGAIMLIITYLKIKR